MLGESFAGLRTARLLLEPVGMAHAQDFVAFYGNAAVMAIRKYGVLDEGAARAQVEGMRAHWREYGFGMYALRETVTGAFAGECGLRWLEDRSDVELSYGLLPTFRDQGYATEAARAVLDFGQVSLGLSCVVALSRGDNRGSHRVLEKLGMQLLWRKQAGEHGLVKYQLAFAARD